MLDQNRCKAGIQPFALDEEFIHYGGRCRVDHRYVDHLCVVYRRVHERRIVHGHSVQGARRRQDQAHRIVQVGTL